jgi:thioredoxin reductase
MFHQVKSLFQLVKRSSNSATSTCRSSGSATMSHYLIDQIKRTPNIRLRPRTEIERVEGEGRVEQVAFTSLDDGSCRVEEAEALFVLSAPAREATGFLPTCSATPKGSPSSLETSVPGLFAAGDLRAGAMNRVASSRGRGVYGCSARTRLPGADLIRSGKRFWDTTITLLLLPAMNGLALRQSRGSM